MKKLGVLQGMGGTTRKEKVARNVQTEKTEKEIKGEGEESGKGKKESAITQKKSKKAAGKGSFNKIKGEGGRRKRSIRGPRARRILYSGKTAERSAPIPSPYRGEEGSTSSGVKPWRGGGPKIYLPQRERDPEKCSFTQEKGEQ